MPCPWKLLPPHWITLRFPDFSDSSALSFETLPPSPGPCAFPPLSVLGLHFMHLPPDSKPHFWEGWHLSCFPLNPLPLAGLRAQEASDSIYVNNEPWFKSPILPSKVCSIECFRLCFLTSAPSQLQFYVLQVSHWGLLNNTLLAKQICVGSSKTEKTDGQKSELIWWRWWGSQWRIRRLESDFFTSSTQALWMALHTFHV